MHLTNEEHSHCGACGGQGAEHPHSHEHPHEHCPAKEGQPKDEDTAVLAYMLDHNKHHAQELAAIAKHLREQGKDDAAIQIEKGVDDFEKGNMRLSIALSLVQ